MINFTIPQQKFQLQRDHQASSWLLTNYHNAWRNVRSESEIDSQK